MDQNQRIYLESRQPLPDTLARQTPVGHQIDTVSTTKARPLVVFRKTTNAANAMMVSASTGPAPAYQATSASSPLNIDRALYERIHTSSKRLLSSTILPIRSGLGWELQAGQICRIVTPEGPQVGDLNLWNRHEPRERFWASRTRQLQASHVRVLDRLWSCLPWVRPMVTVTGDSLGERFGGGGGGGDGMDEDGARVHDLLGTRCDPYSMYFSDIRGSLKTPD